MISPSMDGITHINIHSNGATDLGRKLCDLAHTPFVHPEYGRFECFEAYRHWCRSGKIHHVLKELKSEPAKLRGSKFRNLPNPRYDLDIIEGIHCKLLQTEGLLDDVMFSTLPFTSYFVFGISIRVLKHGKILTKELTKIRKGQPLLF